MSTRSKTLMAAGAIALAMGTTGTASADPPRLAAVRERVQNIDARTTALRRRLERSDSAVKRDAERIVAVIESQKLSIKARLAIFELLGATPPDDAAPVDEMETAAKTAERLLKMVEGWYNPH